MVEYLLREQMPDGGWNCQRYRGAKHSSFHTTINVLEGLRAYAQSGGERAEEFQASEAPYDPRLEDPIGLLLRKRRKDGRWVLQNRHPGREFFAIEAAGKPSRWNTLRALRVLRWWQKAAELEP